MVTENHGSSEIDHICVDFHKFDMEKKLYHTLENAMIEMENLKIQLLMR